MVFMSLLEFLRKMEFTQGSSEVQSAFTFSRVRFQTYLNKLLTVLSSWVPNLFRVPEYMLPVHQTGSLSNFRFLNWGIPNNINPNRTTVAYSPPIYRLMIMNT